MTHSTRITSKNPTCLVFLLDQSSSMRQPMPDGNGKSKAEVLADAINKLLYNIVLRCRKERDEPLRNYFDIALIGYGDQAASLFPGYTLIPVQELARMNARFESGALPIWVDPKAEGTTAMCAAIGLAGQITEGWVHSHQASFPPLVFNITDGASTDGDPEPWAQRLQTLGTADGGLLMFNINISSTGGRPLKFPDAPTALPDEYAKKLFRMSSALTPRMGSYALEDGITVSPATRGFVYNADVDAMIQALDVGTKPLEVR
jgi:hypothetical protein